MGAVEIPSAVPREKTSCVLVSTPRFYSAGAIQAPWRRFFTLADSAHFKTSQCPPFVGPRGEELRPISAY